MRRPAARFVAGLSNGSWLHTFIFLHTSPAYCAWSCFQCTPLICNSPLSDGCDIVAILMKLQSLSTIEPPMRRGQQPDSRLMMLMRRGSWCCSQPTLSAIGATQLQSPCLNVVGMVVVVVVGSMRYGVASNTVGASTDCACALSANTVITDRIVVILMIVRICRLSGWAGTGVFNCDVLRGSDSTLVQRVSLP